ncbi:MAG: c-type cytochrome [Pseudomonadota bacterium]
MPRIKAPFVMAGFIGLALSGLAGAADIHTQSIAATCMSCHGPGGKSQGAIPSIAGLDKDYFVKAMKDFKSGARPSTIMKRHATGYTDAEFEAMAAYFAGLKK